MKIEIAAVESFHTVLSKKQITMALIRLRGCAGWSAPVLFANSRRQVSHVNAHTLAICFPNLVDIQVTIQKGTLPRALNILYKNLSFFHRTGTVSNIISITEPDPAVGRAERRAGKSS